MKAEAIIFDKDGTLIDFDSFWVPVSEKAVKKVLSHFGREDASIHEILEAFGVCEGITDIEGTLCKGTYEELGQILYSILNKDGCDLTCTQVTKALVKAYHESSDAGEIRPTCTDLAQVLRTLKEQNKKLAVVTTDCLRITRENLQKLGIEELFDRIYTDDGHLPTKPDPACLYDFCEFAGLSADAVVMVGDTMTDMIFAKKAGVGAIGIAKNERNTQILAPYAMTVLPDPSHLLNVLK